VKRPTGGRFCTRSSVFSASMRNCIWHCVSACRDRSGHDHGYVVFQSAVGYDALEGHVPGRRYDSPGRWLSVLAGYHGWPIPRSCCRWRWRAGSVSVCISRCLDRRRALTCSCCRLTAAFDRLSRLQPTQRQCRRCVARVEEITLGLFVRRWFTVCVSQSLGAVCWRAWTAPSAMRGDGSRCHDCKRFGSQAARPAHAAADMTELRLMSTHLAV